MGCAPSKVNGKLTSGEVAKVDAANLVLLRWRNKHVKELHDNAYDADGNWRYWLESNFHNDVRDHALKFQNSARQFLLTRGYMNIEPRNFLVESSVSETRLAFERGLALYHLNLSSADKQQMEATNEIKKKSKSEADEEMTRLTGHGGYDFTTRGGWDFCEKWMLSRSQYSSSCEAEDD